MEADLLHDRMWMYLTTDAIMRKREKLQSDDSSTYAKAYSLHLCEHPSQSDSDPDSFLMKWKEE